MARPAGAGTLLFFLLVSAGACRAQSASALMAIPIETNSLTAGLAVERAEVGDVEGQGVSAQAARADLWFPEGGCGPFSLTAVYLAYGDILIGGALTEVPSLSLASTSPAIELPGFGVATLDASLRFRSPPWSGSVSLLNIFVPRLEPEVTGIPDLWGEDAALVPDAAFGAVGSLGYDGFSLTLAWAEGGGSVVMDGDVRAGGISGSLGLASLGWDDWGLLVGYISGTGNLSLRSWLLSMFGLPWLDGEATLDLRCAAAWGRLSLGSPRLEADLDFGIGALWNLGTSATFVVGQSNGSTSLQRMESGLGSLGTRAAPSFASMDAHEAARDFDREMASVFLGMEHHRQCRPFESGRRCPDDHVEP